MPQEIASGKWWSLAEISRDLNLSYGVIFNRYQRRLFVGIKFHGLVLVHDDEYKRYVQAGEAK